VVDEDVIVVTQRSESPLGHPDPDAIVARAEQQQREFFLFLITLERNKLCAGPSEHTACKFTEPHGAARIGRNRRNSMQARLRLLWKPRKLSVRKTNDALFRCHP